MCRGLRQITYASGGTNSFPYDGIGRRVTKTDSTGSYSFVYDGNRIISDGHAVYTRAGEARLISERRGNNSRWHHSDGLTSTRTLTSSSQTVTDTFRYDVWGDIAERTGTTPTPHQFVGALGYEREADSGLIFIGTRYYDPSVGRFISQDAAQYGVNWYVYAANNPVSGFDYAGQWWETALDIAGLILDVKDFIEEPSLGNAAWIIGDVASIILPTPTPSVIKHGGKLLGHAEDVIRHGDEAVDAAHHFANEFVSVYHGSINDATDILKNGLDPNRLPTWVTTDIKAAENAIGPNRFEISQGIARDPGIIESRIPRDDFDRIIAPSGRPYPIGFGGEILDSIEYVLRTPEQVALFNRYIVR